VTAAATFIAGVAVLIGAYRAIALGDQSTARGLLLFGGIVFLTNVSAWIGRRLREDD
jgi:hypothetical protein